jgi:hypothetical protein
LPSGWQLQLIDWEWQHEISGRDTILSGILHPLSKQLETHHGHPVLFKALKSWHERRVHDWQERHPLQSAPPPAAQTEWVELQSGDSTVAEVTADRNPAGDDKPKRIKRIPVERDRVRAILLELDQEQRLPDTLQPHEVRDKVKPRYLTRYKGAAPSARTQNRAWDEFLKERAVRTSK